jgi:glycerol-3-phosphate dehydrogenase
MARIAVIGCGHWGVALSHERLLDERQCARIARLAQPEESLLAHLSVPLVARDLDQLRNRLVLGKL